MGKKGTKRKTQWRTLSITESPPKNTKSALGKQFASEHNNLSSTSTIETNNVEEAIFQDDDCSHHRSYSNSLYLKRKSSAPSNYRNDYRNNSSYSYSNKHNNNSTSSTSSLYSSSRYSSSFRRRPFSSLQNGSSRYSVYSTDRTSNRGYRNANTTNSHDAGNFTTKPLFNEEEYTRISTPRQDVIFKKGCFAQPKKYVSSTDTNTTSSAAASVVSAEESVSALSVPSLSPEQCSSIADSLDPEQGLFYSFVDQNGIVYSYVPNGYDQYNGQMIMLPYGYPPYMCSPDAISPTSSNEENELNRMSVESHEMTPSDLNETKVINEVPTDASSSNKSSDETPSSRENADNKQCDEDITVPNEMTTQTVMADVAIAENQSSTETTENTTEAIESAEKTTETEAESMKVTEKLSETVVEPMQSPSESGLEPVESAAITEVVPSIPDQFYNYGYAPFYSPQILYPYMIPQQFVPVYGSEFDIPAEEDYSDCIEDQNRIRYRNRKKRKSVDGNSTGVSAATTDYSEEDSEYGESHPEDDEISNSDQNANLEAKERLLDSNETENKPIALNANVEEFVPRGNIKSNLNVNVQEFLPSRLKGVSSKSTRVSAHGKELRTHETTTPSMSSTSAKPNSLATTIKSQLSFEKQTERKPSELTLAEKIKLNLAQESKYRERDSREQDRTLSQRKIVKSNVTRKNLTPQSKKGGVRKKPELDANKRALPSRLQPDAVPCSQPSYAQIANNGVHDNEQIALSEAKIPSTSKQAEYLSAKNNTTKHSQESDITPKTQNKSTNSLSPSNTEEITVIDSPIAESWQTVKPRGKRSKHIKETPSEEVCYEQERLEESPLQNESVSKLVILLDSPKDESDGIAEKVVEAKISEQSLISADSEAVKDDASEPNNIFETPKPAANKKTPKSKGRKGTKKVSNTPVKSKQKKIELVEPVSRPLQKTERLIPEEREILATDSDFESPKLAGNSIEFACENDADFNQVEPDFSFDRMYFGKGFARRPIDILKGFDYKFKSKSLLKEEEEMVLSVIKSINNTNSPNSSKTSPTTSIMEEDDSDDKTIVDTDKIDTGESGSETDTISDMSLHNCAELKIIHETDKIDVCQIAESTQRDNDVEAIDETVEQEAVSPKQNGHIDRSVTKEEEVIPTSDLEYGTSSGKEVLDDKIQDTGLQGDTLPETENGFGENQDNSILDYNSPITEELSTEESITSEMPKSNVFENLNLLSDVERKGNESEFKCLDAPSIMSNGNKYLEPDSKKTDNMPQLEAQQMAPSMDGICLLSGLETKENIDKTENIVVSQLPVETIVDRCSMTPISEISQNTSFVDKPIGKHSNIIDTDNSSIKLPENNFEHLNGDMKKNETNSCYENKDVDCQNASIQQLNIEISTDKSNTPTITSNSSIEHIATINGFGNGIVDRDLDYKEDKNATNNSFIEKQSPDPLEDKNQDCTDTIFSNGINCENEPMAYGLRLMSSETGVENTQNRAEKNKTISAYNQIDDEPHLSQRIGKEQILSERFVQHSSSNDADANSDFADTHIASSEPKTENLITNACDKLMKNDAQITLQSPNYKLFKERSKSPFESKNSLLEDLDDLFVSRPLRSRSEHGSSDYLSCVNALSTIIMSRESSMESDRSTCGSTRQNYSRERSLESQISRECSLEPGLSRKSSIDPEYVPSRDYLTCVNILSNLIRSREGSIDSDSRPSSKATTRGDTLEMNSQTLVPDSVEPDGEILRKSTDFHSSCSSTDISANLVDINQFSSPATDHVQLTRDTHHYETSELAESISDAMIFSELLFNSNVDFKPPEDTVEKKSARVLNASISCDRSSGIGSDCEDNQPTSPKIPDGNCDPNETSSSLRTAHSEETTKCKQLFPINDIVSESVSPQPNKDMPNHVLPIISQTNSVNCDNQSVSYTSAKDLFDPGVDPGPCSSDTSPDEDHLTISTRSKFPSRHDDQSNLFPLTQAVRQWLAEESKEPTPERLFRIPDDPVVRSYLTKQILSTSLVDDSEDWTCTEESGDDCDVSDDLKLENDAPECVSRSDIRKPKNLQSNPLHASFCNAFTPDSDSDYNSDSNEQHCTSRKDDNTCKRVAETVSEMEINLPYKNDLLEYWDDEFLRNPEKWASAAGAGPAKQTAKLKELQDRSTSANRDSTRSPSTDMEPYESVYGKTIDYNQLIACNYEFLSNNIISFNDNDAKSADVKTQETIGTKPEESNDEKWKLLGSSKHFYNTIHRNTSASTVTTRAAADSHTNRKSDNCLKPPEVCCMLM